MTWKIQHRLPYYKHFVIDHLSTFNHDRVSTLSMACAKITWANRQCREAHLCIMERVYIGSSVLSQIRYIRAQRDICPKWQPAGVRNRTSTFRIPHLLNCNATSILTWWVTWLRKERKEIVFRSWVRTKEPTPGSENFEKRKHSR